MRFYRIFWFWESTLQVSNKWVKNSAAWSIERKADFLIQMSLSEKKNRGYFFEATKLLLWKKINSTSALVSFSSISCFCPLQYVEFEIRENTYTLEARDQNRPVDENPSSDIKKVRHDSAGNFMFNKDATNMWAYLTIFWSRKRDKFKTRRRERGMKLTDWVTSERSEWK